MADIGTPSEFQIVLACDYGDRDVVEKNETLQHFCSDVGR
jgi:hypothetical protein